MSLSTNGNVGIGVTNPQGKLDLNNNAIINVAVPINANDAANKAYVDAANSSGVQYVGLAAVSYATSGSSVPQLNSACSAAYAGSHGSAVPRML